MAPTSLPPDTTDAPAQALLLEDLRGFGREAVGRDAGELRSSRRPP
jgi:hypothetical protein